MSFCVSALKPADQKSGGADRGDGELDRRRQFEEDMRARDQVDARRHHGGRMDQGAGRAWDRPSRPAARSAAAVAPICPPPHPAAAPPPQSRMPIPWPSGLRRVQQILDAERPQAVEQQKQADCHGGIAHARHDEGFSPPRARSPDPGTRTR